MRAENDMFLLWGSTDLVFVWVVDIDLIFVCGPEITSFSISIEINLDFVRLVEIDLIWRMELDFISVQR